MTNNVTTRCVVRGPDADVDAFRRRMIVPLDGAPHDPDLEFDFGQLIPVPDAPERDPKHPEFKYWYKNWTQKHWGAWGTYDYRAIAEQPFTFEFETAYLFPDLGFKRLAREFPTLEFDCLTFDESWNFAAHGCFNPRPGSVPWSMCEPTEALYEEIYGRKFVRDPWDMPMEDTPPNNEPTPISSQPRSGPLARLAGMLGWNRR